MRFDSAGLLGRPRNLRTALHQNQPRLLVLWGRHDPSFELSETGAYRRDVPSAQVHFLEGGHFALDTAADEAATLIRQFLAE